MCEDELKDNMKNYSKLKDGPMINENFAVEDYIKKMTVEDARVNFALSVEVFHVRCIVQLPERSQERSRAVEVRQLHEWSHSDAKPHPLLRGFCGLEEGQGPQQ